MTDKMQSLGISVFHAIKGDILAAVLEPGEKLGLKMLSERYACGTSPIREALNQLTVEGWVARIDKRGFFVSETSADDFADVLHNRCLLESAALRLSIEKGDAAWEEQVLVTHFRMSAIERNAADLPGSAASAWETAHRRFHAALISACGSKILLENCERLYDLNIRYRVLARHKAQIARNVNDEHDRIKDLTLKRDADGAVAALVGHYVATGDFLFPAADSRQGN
ncbi:GntR family transcriptional regulator [Roseicyclus sp.]|uniref:GntR family transcriptional regulator n=1 Tax=Roseicyclus sp. TaxID=1914329 RepID=UPI003F6AE577